MSTVTIPGTLGGSGTPFSDGTGAFGMASGNGYGYKTYLIPMLSEVIAACSAAVVAGNTAVNAPGAAGTSTTSMTIGTGTQTFTTQTGKAWQVGQPAMIASTASPLNWMAGTITAYNTSTGAMTVVTARASGTGTFTAWTVSLTGPVVPDQTSVISHNRMINGSMGVSQYGSKTLAASGSTYGGADRYITTVTATTVSATIQQATAPVAGLSSSGKSQQLTVTSTGATSFAWTSRLPAEAVVDLNSKTVTFGAKVYQATGASVNFQATVGKAVTLDNFGSVTTLATGTSTAVPSGVVTTVSVTVALGATDATNGIQLQLQSASLAAQTASVWNTSDWHFDIGVAYPATVEKFFFPDEYLRCTRFYYAPADAMLGMAFSTTGAIFPVQFPVPMRITPTQVAINNSPGLTIGGATAAVPGTWSTSTLGTQGAVAQFARTTGTWTVSDAIAINDAARAVPSLGYNAEL